MSEPSISVHLEPRRSLTEVSYLRFAPYTLAGGKDMGCINLVASVKNTGDADLVISKVELSVPNSTTQAKNFTPALRIDKGKTEYWVQSDDFVFVIPPGPLSLRLKFWKDITPTPKTVTSAMLAHTNPTPEHSYRFWGAVRDLRPGEFWQVHGTSHGATKSQTFGYDVGVSVESGTGHQGLLPNADFRINESHRIWGKPIYSIADGKVRDFLNTYPTNPRALTSAETQAKNWYELAFPDLFALQNTTGHGNGNFFTITTGDETVLYAHLQPGSLNPKFLKAGSVVKAGDFLGLAGNSGNSSKPHFHIHANKAPGALIPPPDSWDTVARPIVMHGARAVAWSEVTSNPVGANWFALNKRGIPPVECAIWPSDSPVAKLRHAAVRHMAISEKGQLWIVRTDNGIRTTNDLLPNTGVYLDVLPGGSAKEIALVKEKPYIIGMNDALWEGRPDGWFQVTGSPALKRIAVNPSNGLIWGLTPTHGIISFNVSHNLWKPDPAGKKAKDICAWEGGVCIIGLDDRIYEGGPGSDWKLLPGDGTAKRIAVDAANGQLWVIGMNDGIWSYAGSAGWNEHPEQGRGKDLLVFQHSPFVIGTDDNIWQSAGAAGWNHLNVVEAT